MIFVLYMLSFIVSFTVLYIKDIVLEGIIDMSLRNSTLLM